MGLIGRIHDFELQAPVHFLRNIEAAGNRDRFWGAVFNLDTDISGLFPYLNAVVENAVYYETPEHIRMTLEDRRCHLFPQSVSVYFFEDRDHARSFADKFIVFLNDIHDRRASIQPNHDKLRPVSVVDLLKILPRTNCGACGHPTCQAFAVTLNRKKASIEACPDLAAPLAIRAVYPVFDEKGAIRSTVTVETSPFSRQTAREGPNTVPAPVAVDDIPVPDQIDPRYRLEPTFGLSEREIEVLRRVAEGLTNVEIAAALFISPHTVKSHVIHIFNKLGVNDRTQAAVLATRQGIL